MRELVHEPMKTRSIADVLDRRPGLEAHVVERALDGLALGRVVVARPGRGRGRRSARPCPGFVPQVTCGTSCGDVDLDHAVEGRVRIGAQRAPVVERLLPGRALRRAGPALDVRERRVVRRDHARARAPPSIVMLQIVMRPSIESASTAGPAYSIDVADAAARRRSGRSRRAPCPWRSRRTAARRRTRIRIVFGRACRQRLRRQHVLDLARCRSRTRAHRRHRASRCASRRRRSSSRAASARAPGPSRGRSPRCRCPVAFSGTPNSAQFACERVELGLRDRVADRAALGRDVVVHRRDRQVGPPHRPAGQAQPLERLRASSPRGRGAGRCRAAPARPGARRRRAPPRSCRTASSGISGLPSPRSCRRSASRASTRASRRGRPAARHPAGGRRDHVEAVAERRARDRARTSCTRFRPWRWNGPRAW